MLPATLALLVAGLPPGPTEPAEKSKPVNLLVFIADDVSPDDLGCYGHPKAHPPTLDRLARDGLRFDSAFLTCSSCSPSRCSILTGRYPHSTGAPELHMGLPREQGTVGRWLKDAGYYTAVAGKWHLGEPAKQHF